MNTGKKPASSENDWLDPGIPRLSVQFLAKPLSKLRHNDKLFTVLSTQQIATLRAANCEVAFDNTTRQLYATDASHYQIVPLAVAFPQNTAQASHVIQAAQACGIAVTPRGAGSGLAGGALGDGIIVDFARYNRQIWDFNPEQRTVRVGAGVVLDQLNQFLRPAGLCFGPEVATSSRATLGGMIANDSSGANTPVYGTTGQHVREIELILADGKVTRIGSHLPSLQQLRHLVEDMVSLNSLLITEQFPRGLLKRWPGYGLARALEQPGNLIPILCGSEGTLAGIFSAEINLVPLPQERGVGLIFFDSVTEAMLAMTTLLDLAPAAIEHIDRPLFDQTLGRREFRAVRRLLDLDNQPCESILLVEFQDAVAEKLAKLETRHLGLRHLMLPKEAEQNLVWAMRKAGLSLLTSRPSSTKPACFIEDTAVRPLDLPAYVQALQNILQTAGVEASFYGHAAAGLLHVRPVLDLHQAEDLQKFRSIADEVAALVKQFNGSLAGEHGVGIARTEYLKSQVGSDIYHLMSEIKQAFDPNNLFNPGKIISDARYKIDTRLRQHSETSHLPLPFEPQLAFAARDGSFAANLEQCNGCGGCLKHTVTMCPTYQATGEEGMSPRGRSNLIRAALEQREIHDPLRGEELSYALENCLGCRACTTECPSNVNLPLLKAELLHARIRRDGLTLQQRLISNVDLLGRLGCKAPGLMNFVFSSRSVRHVFGRFFGIAGERETPRYAHQRFDHWFAKRPAAKPGPRGRVLLWDDTFVRYHQPEVGIAAVAVLEAAGFEVVLPQQRQCCGRPAFSQGHLTEAARLGRHNLALLAAQHELPIIFLEPSCYSMFKEDYRELKLEGAEAIAKRCFLFEEFIEGLLQKHPGALIFNQDAARIVIHTHCHAKATTDSRQVERLMKRLPNRKVHLIDSGCCGMAGAFGMLESKYDLSLKIAQPLIAEIQKQPYGTIVIASGTSCRHQIQQLSTYRTQHLACILAEALGGS